MQLLSVKAAAAMLGTSKHTIYRAIEKGELRWINVSTGEGRPWVRIDEGDLRAWVDSRASKAAS